MRKDPTEFRKRFAAWQDGKMPYEAGKAVQWQEDTDYGVPFIESKRVKLTNAGYATGAVLSTNMLDSIADNAVKAGLPVRTALGLAVKESTLGNPTDDRSARTLLSAENKAKWANAGYGQHINEYGDYVNSRELINWWKDLDDKRYGKNGRSVLEGGFEFYKNNPHGYNPGQRNHPQLVEKRAKELMGSPLVQLWLKERSLKLTLQLKKNFGKHWLRPYEDGKMPYKAGKVVLNDDLSLWQSIKNGMRSVILTPVNKLRNYIYKNVSPNGSYNIKQNIEDFGHYDPYKTEVDDVDMDLQVSNEIWAKYLQIPYKDRHETGKHHRLYLSKYKPTKSKDDAKYTAIRLDDYHKDRLIEETDDLKLGQSVNSEVFSDYNLGIHTIGRGSDSKKGEYRSYYDKWDLNPFTNKYRGINIPIINKVDDITLGVGKPFEIYDRLYLSDYYGVDPKLTAANKGDYYGGWLPEVFINSKNTYNDFLR